VSEERVVVSEIMDAYGVDDVTKEAALDHLENELEIMHEEVLKESSDARK